MSTTTSFVVKHNSACACGADLTKENAVEVHISVAGHELDILSQVAFGLLDDTEDEVIKNGYHAGSNCAACGEDLEELE